MAEMIAAFLVGLIAGFVICTAAVGEGVKERIAAGVWIVDGKAYRVTPMEEK